MLFISTSTIYRKPHQKSRSKPVKSTVAEERRLRQERIWEDMDEIREIVKELGSIYVEVFELWADGLTEAESAARLSIPPNTVKSRRNILGKSE